jgi:hypothetical protein
MQYDIALNKYQTEAAKIGDSLADQLLMNAQTFNRLPKTSKERVLEEIILKVVNGAQRLQYYTPN